MWAGGIGWADVEIAGLISRSGRIERRHRPKRRRRALENCASKPLVLDHPFLKTEKLRPARIGQNRGQLLEQIAKVVKLALIRGRFLGPGLQKAESCKGLASIALQFYPDCVREALSSF